VASRGVGGFVASPAQDDQLVLTGVRRGQKGPLKRRIGFPIITRGDEFRVDACRRYLVGQPNTGEFFYVTFSIIFEIFGEIKNTKIQNFHFEKLFRLKICSIQNMFTFEFHVQIRKKCSNSNLFKLEFVQIQIYSNSILFIFEFVQTRFC
jgi:hypothetical protein